MLYSECVSWLRAEPFTEAETDPGRFSNVQEEFAAAAMAATKRRRGEV